nr:N-acetylmuramoyl-L-alanine amidase [Peribacillus deserti]
MTSTVPASPKPSTPVSTPVPAQTSGSTEYVKIVKNDVNLRSGPGEKYSILKTADTGEKFRKTSAASGWIQIELPDKRKAWVADWLITYNVSNTRGLKGKTIVLDAGHGGTDPGAIGNDKKTFEKNLTLKMVQQTAALLKGSGANVILTRSSDTYPSLDARVNLAEKYRADAFISVHYNSESKHSANGIETYYYSASKDKKLADTLHSKIVKASGMKDREVRQNSFRVISTNNRPAVLLELGFISNSSDLSKIKTEKFQNDVSMAIYEGLKTYFN